MLLSSTNFMPGCKICGAICNGLLKPASGALFVVSHSGKLETSLKSYWMISYEDDPSSPEDSIQTEYLNRSLSLFVCARLCVDLEE